MLIDIYDTPKNFNAEFEYYCFKNCYRQLLEYYGIEGAGYYIDCTSDWTFQAGHDFSFGYNFLTGDFYSSFLPPFDKKVRMYSEKDYPSDKIWEINKRKISEGVPLIVAVDVFHLDYTPYYKKKHSFHSLLLCGYTEEDGRLSIVDWYTPWFYKGQTDIDSLSQARSSTNPSDGLLSGTPINYMWAEVDRNGWEKDERELLADTVNLSLDRFYIDKKENEATKGFKALQELRMLLGENASLENSLRKQFLEDMHGKLYFTPVRKNLLKWYLETAHKEHKYPKLGLVLKALADTIDSWKRLLSTIIKCSMVNSEENYTTVTKQFEDAFLREKDFHYQLYEASRTIP